MLQAIDPKNTTSSRDLLLLGADIRETVVVMGLNVLVQKVSHVEASREVQGVMDMRSWE